MNSVEKVKALCKEKKIPISKLERDLGFGNGYIGQLRKGTFPDDRLLAISNYLGVTTDFLMGAEGKQKSPTSEEVELSKERIQEMLEDMTASDLESLLSDVAVELAKKRGSR